MRAWPVAAAVLALLGCGETRSDVARSGASDPSSRDAGDAGRRVIVFGSGGGSAVEHTDAAYPPCGRVTLVRERSEAGPSCTFQLPDPSTFGVSSYDPIDKITVIYADTAGPRYELSLPLVRTAADCTPVTSGYYYTPSEAAPEHIVLCPAACALHYDAEAGTVGGALVAAYGCGHGDPVR